MFASINKLSIAASVSMFALTATAFASETPAISEIKVDATFSAAQDSNAAALYPDITDDIRLAVAERVQTSTDAADPIINIDVRKVALDGDTILPDSAEFNQLEGVVSIMGASGGVGDMSFPVMISAATGDVPVDGYVVITPSKDDFYDAMVMAFADNVAEALETVNTSGDPISR